VVAYRLELIRFLQVAQTRDVQPGGGADLDHGVGGQLGERPGPRKSGAEQDLDGDPDQRLA
jgi:hypothetical protein